MTTRAEMTDLELLQSYSTSGDSEFLGAFLLRYEHSLLRFVVRFLGDHHVAQDVVQETFLQVARHPKRLLKVENHYNWLLRIARNIGISRIRRNATARKHTLALKDKIESTAAEKNTTTASSALEAEELRDQVLSTINQLKPRTREILLLKVQEEKSYKEISMITGLTVTNIGFILHSAMKELSGKLTKSRREQLI